MLAERGAAGLRQRKWPSEKRHLAVWNSLQAGENKDLANLSLQEFKGGGTLAASSRTAAARHS